jgi:hypothetical protein
MPPLPQTVRIAAWLFVATTILYNILLPGGRLALNALHPQSRGESPLLSVMAMGAGIAFVAPWLLLSALAYFNILQGRNWARVLLLFLTALSVYLGIQSLRLVLLISGVQTLPFWILQTGAEPFLYIVVTALLFFGAGNAWFRHK